MQGVPRKTVRLIFLLFLNPEVKIVSEWDFFKWRYVKELIVYTYIFNNDEDLNKVLEKELLRIPQNFFPRVFDLCIRRYYINVTLWMRLTLNNYVL